MELILMGVILFGAAAAMFFLKFLELGQGLTLAILLPLILVVIFCLAWVQSKNPETD